MTVYAPASDLAKGDFVTRFGTIRTVTEHKDKNGNVVTYDIEFWNGVKEIGIDPETVFEVVQGKALYNNDGLPSQSVRPGLQADHGGE